MAGKKSDQSEKKERLTFFIDPSLRAEYEQLAKVDHRELGDIIRIALELAKPLMEARVSVSERFTSEMIEELLQVLENESAPDRTRTYNQLIKSWLSRLSRNQSKQPKQLLPFGLCSIICVQDHSNR